MQMKLRKMNEILLETKHQFIFNFEKSSEKVHKKYIASLLKNLEYYGFTLSKDFILQLESASKESIVDLNFEFIEILKKLHFNVGTPFYPNFPEQVMEASDAELYINALMHYFGDYIGARIIPVFEKKERFPLVEKTKLIVVDIGSESSFNQFIFNLLKSPTSLSETDLEYLEKAIDIDISIFDLKHIVHKETLAFVANMLIEKIGVKELNSTMKENLFDNFKTATDVLRLAIAMSTGDVSLALNTRFRNFKRAERRLLLELLNKCNNIEEDMLKHKKKWIKLGEKLHPGEYKQFEKVHQAFNKIRNNLHIFTFNNIAEDLYKNNELNALALHLKQRPGEFTRRLDSILRVAKNKDEQLSILNDFNSIVDKVSTLVLLQVISHFKNRKTNWRVFFPKGQICKAYGIKNNLPKIKKEMRNKTIEICENSLKKRFGELEPLNKVFVDEKLKNYIVPFNQRSASKTLKTVARGSKFDLPKNRTIRFFLHWLDGKERTDIDLSTTFLDENFNYVNHISYTKLRALDCVHSGDFTSAPHPDGASEYIDCNINSLKNNGVRYVVMHALSFTQQPYKDLPECYVGWMIRKNPTEGEVFERKTVEQKIDLTADTKYVIPIVFDIEKMQGIWLDLAITKTPRFKNNVENNFNTTTSLIESILESERFNIYDLLMLHVANRGELVDNENDADVVFSEEFGWKIDEIIGNFL